MKNQPSRSWNATSVIAATELPGGVLFYDQRPALSDFRSDVLLGLSREPKQLPAKYFYDKRGSELFEEICAQPEYYLTRAECQILEQHAAPMVKVLGDDCALVELGSGSSRKARYLLDAAGGRISYVAVDIAREQLRAATTALAQDYADVPIMAICADYSKPFALPPEAKSRRRTALFFPGSTIGNMEALQVRRFLKNCKALLGKDGIFIIGADNKKEPGIFNAAYNDGMQKTAAFNLNLLHRINRAMGADFDLTEFRHRAFYNAAAGRVEMHIVSVRDQTVRIGDARVTFREGESIHTENCYKYEPREFQALVEGCGYVSVDRWSDSGNLFSIYAFRAV